MTAVRRSAVAVAAVVALVSAVWAALAGPGSAGPPSGGGRGPAASLVLTNRSEGSSASVARGGRVEVELAGGGTIRWSPVTVRPATGVLSATGSSSSGDGSSTAAYRAVGRGRAELSATGAPICVPGRACPQFVLLWEAHVTVS